MSRQNVIVTIDQRKVADVKQVVEQLKLEGLEVAEMDSVLNTTQIRGTLDGTPERINRHGVSCEAEGWKEAT